MTLINSVAIKHFKAIREAQKIDLLQGSYVIGGNNSGKTTVLQAIELFFSNNLPSDEIFLNKSEYLAKKEGYNRFYMGFPNMFKISETLSRKSLESNAGHKSETVSRILSWSLYCELLKEDNVDARKFYEIEAGENGWSMRELRRQMDSRFVGSEAAQAMFDG